MSEILVSWFNQHLTLWVVFGLLGQLMFTLRFLVQWVASEREKRSVVPEIFWYFSLAGGIILLLYAINRQDPVFIIGQGAGILIYLRNIYLIWCEKNSLKPAALPKSGE